MLALLKPSLCVASVYDIDLDALWERGVRGVIADVDNTLVPWGGSEPDESLLRWLSQVRRRGFALCLLSNAGGRRVQALARACGVPAISGATKPLRAGFRRAMQLMGTRAPETAVVGDQVFTDVLGGNRLGLYTVLVQPISRRELFTTRLVRLLERWIARRSSLPR